MTTTVVNPSQIAPWSAGDAMFGYGLEDAAPGSVRVVSDPTPIAGHIFGYFLGLRCRAGIAAVGHLEDIVGKHIWVGFTLYRQRCLASSRLPVGGRTKCCFGLKLMPIT